MALLALGIDVGTTAVKAVVLDERGAAVAQASAPHDCPAPRPGWAEGDPAAWWSGAVAAIAALGTRVPLDAVAVIGASGMVPAVIALDSAGAVLRPSIQQNDARAAAEVDWLRARLDAADFLAATGQPWSPQLVPPRLLWLRRHEPAVERRIRRVVGSYDYVAHRLTGEWSLERNWALEAGCWDARRESLYPPMLAAAELDERWLPPVREPQAVIGAVTRAAAEATGLRAGVPVVAGSADHVAAALAAGLGPGDAVVKIGGGGDLLCRVDRFAPDARLYIDYHDVPGAFLLNGCMASSGALVKWLGEQCARELAPEERYARLDAEAAAVAPGSEGLIVLPYFLGEKTPIFDPHARGVFFGLTLAHGRGHLHRAALEAVAYGFRHHLEVVESAGHGVARARIMDGGARSALWRQIVADVIGRPVEYAPGADVGSAHGAALVAGVAGGFWGWEAPRPPDDARICHEPRPEAADAYARGYRRYRELYEHLRQDFRALARAQEA